MSKFKVGDRVRATYNCSQNSFRKGWEGVVVKKGVSGCRIKFENRTTAFAWDNEIELIEENEMSNENELRFGHRVIVWDNENDNKAKGRYVSCHKRKKHPHYAIADGSKCPASWQHAKLDPEATEFLAGDVVEFVEKPGSDWRTGKYNFKNLDGQHNVWKQNEFSCYVFSVRYPQPEPSLKEQLDKAIEGGSRCILMNPYAAKELETLDWLNKFTYSINGSIVHSFKYKELAINITDTVKTFEVIK